MSKNTNEKVVDAQVGDNFLVGFPNGEIQVLKIKKYQIIDGHLLLEFPEQKSENNGLVMKYKPVIVGQLSDISYFAELKVTEKK